MISMKQLQNANLGIICIFYCLYVQKAKDIFSTFCAFVNVMETNFFLFT